MGAYSFATSPWSCSDVTKVIINNGVTNIGSYAFSECYSLKTVTIPDSVTSIDSGAFYYCAHMPSVTIPDSVTSIGEQVFYSCEDLGSIRIPGSVPSIGYRTFCECENLTSVLIPDSVTSIGEQAFSGCCKMTEVTIGSSVTSIGAEAFCGCRSLTSAVILGSGTSIGNYAFGYYYDYNDRHHKYSGFTMYGYEGSTAEAYAKTRKIAFKLPTGECEQCHNGYFEPNIIKGYPATCTVDGLTDGYICPSCGYKEECEVIPALGHKPVIEPAVEATCQHAGHTVGSYCENCGEVYIEPQTIPRLSHKVVVDAAVPADCTHTGLTKGTHCSVCGTVIIEQKVVPITHIPGDPVKENVVDATCTTSGGYDTVIYCTVCSEELSRETTTIGALGHNYVYIAATPATAENMGLTEGVCCDRCGEWLIEQELIPRIGYDLLLGDVDGDGEATVLDATLIQRYATRVNVPYTDKQMMLGDIDGDGELTAVDATFIQRCATRVKTPYPIGEPL